MSVDFIAVPTWAVREALIDHLDNGFCDRCRVGTRPCELGLALAGSLEDGNVVLGPMPTGPMPTGPGPVPIREIVPEVIEDLRPRRPTNLGGGGGAA